MPVTYIRYALLMTVKQLIVGSLLGITAFAALLHRLPKVSSTIAGKQSEKQDTQTARLSRQTSSDSRRDAFSQRKHRKQAEDRSSVNKAFG